jgi:hypothetical protein
VDLLFIQRILWTACIAAQVLLIGSLFTRGLARKYPFFLLYLLSEVISSIVLIQIDVRTQAYAEAFRVYQILAIVLRLGVAGELYERICAHFAGIGACRFGLACLLLSIGGIVSFVSFSPDLSAQMGWPQTVAIAVERFECTALAFVLMGTWFILRRFLRVRPELRWNVHKHWILVSAYFLISAVASFATTMIYAWALRDSWGVEQGRAAIRTVGISMLTAEIVCLWLWFRTFRADGETLRNPTIIHPEVLAVQDAQDRKTLELIESLGR